MGALTVLVLVALLVSLPPLPPHAGTGAGVLRGLLAGRGVRTGLAVTFLVALAHFGSYTYVTPFLAEVTRVGPGRITWLLLAFGVAGLLGNVLAGDRAARAPGPALAAAAALLAVATLLLPLVGASGPGAAAVLVLWGLAYGAVPVCSLTWFLTAAPQAPEAAGVVFTSSFQATISIGSLAGGAVVDHGSTTAVMLLGGATARVAAAAAVAFGGRIRPRTAGRPDGAAVRAPSVGAEPRQDRAATR
ncbi:hypothetical protein [Kitasatospora sp. NPDC058218]|uniref:hypothetical protein n=1 Tax=Kitasatospora sp. NPDC058218 TaxID=3346385 RepID=UPI0036DD38EA